MRLDSVLPTDAKSWDSWIRYFLSPQWPLSLLLVHVIHSMFPVCSHKPDTLKRNKCLTRSISLNSSFFPGQDNLEYSGLTSKTGNWTRNSSSTSSVAHYYSILPNILSWEWTWLLCIKTFLHGVLEILKHSLQIF